MNFGDYTPALATAVEGAHAKLFFGLLVMFVAAKLMAELFERLKQPAVVGEILAGVVIGPGMLAWVAPNELTDLLAELGVIFLLFLVGMETKPGDIFRVGGRAALVAVMGVIVPFVAGFGLMLAWGKPSIEATFVGVAMVATSVGITARVLGQMGLISLQTSRIILGAAVIDDVLGLIILSVVSSLAKGGVDYTQIVITSLLAVGFTLLIALVGARTVNRMQPRIKRLRIGQSWLLFGFSSCLALAFVASYVGVAAIIGAFLAGMALSESTKGTDMPIQAEAVTEFLLPFFLTSIGMKLKLAVFFDADVIVLALAVTVVAVLTKVLGCGLAAAPLGWKKALQIGVGMAPRGEVGIVVAQIGLGLAAVSEAAYGVVLFMAVATTLIAPPLLTVLFKDEQRVMSEGIVPISPIS
ncbi:MAG: cation:proton antiporter [Blastocatellia bacterium]